MVPHALGLSHGEGHPGGIPLRESGRCRTEAHMELKNEDVPKGGDDSMPTDDGQQQDVDNDGAVDPAVTAMDPDHQLSLLQRRLQDLREEHGSVRKELATITGPLALRITEGRSHDDQSNVYEELSRRSIGELMATMNGVNAVHKYLTHLQKLQASLRLEERFVRNLERSTKAKAEKQELLKELLNAIKGFAQASRCLVALEDVKQNPMQSQWICNDILCYSETLEKKALSIGYSLRKIIQDIVQDILRECRWPPPLISPQHANETSMVSDKNWEGWESCAKSLSMLKTVFKLELMLQERVQSKEFHKVRKPRKGAAPAVIHDGFDEIINLETLPVIWPAEDLVFCVRDWMYHHFASGLPTDRPDKPEWLFKTVLKVARRLAPLSEVFQPCLAALELDKVYSFAFEVCRAIASTLLLPLLRQHALPSIASANDPALWLHYVDEAIAFEQSFAPLRGDVTSRMMINDGDHARKDVVHSIAHSSSSLEILFESDEWRESWLDAEREDALQQLQSALDAPDAWHCSIECRKDISNTQENSYEMEGTSTHDLWPSIGYRDTGWVASSHEFCPPSCMYEMIDQLILLLSRGGFIAENHNRAMYMDVVVAAVLERFRSSLVDIMSRGKRFDRLLDPVGISNVGAALCGAHALAHELEEPRGSLLELVSGDPNIARMVEKEASALSLVRRQYTNALTQRALDAFEKDFEAYRSYAMYTYGEVRESMRHVSQESSSPSLAHSRAHHLFSEGNVSWSMDPSSGILLVIERLQSILRLLSMHLDGVIFRDAWRAVATAVNRFFFQEIATEASFHEDGARQFSTDVEATLQVFKGVTSRPAPHFKETLDACRLLLLPANDAAALLQEVRQGGSSDVSSRYNVRFLNQEQALAVLNRRVDLSV